MGMVKIITPGSYDFHEPVAQIVKTARHGLRGADLADFVKRASVQFIDKMASIHFGPGEVPVHLIAVGATEAYGPNRNGDGFKRAVCEEYHPTFTKYARWYRHHENKDTSKGRGIVKLSAYNKEMDRIELLVSLFSTKEAADRHNGLVADEEMEKLANGDDIAVSMACRVSHDVCSSCGNKARTRAEYCDDAMCKHGGLKRNIAKCFEDGEVLHADNPDPSFFDISHVFRPADRIGYVLGKAAAYEMYKAASDAGAQYSGVEWAEKLGVTAPLWLLSEGPWTDTGVVEQLKIAQDLMSLETKISDELPNTLNMTFHPAVQNYSQKMPDVLSGKEKIGQVMCALADAQCMLPIDAFVTLFTDDSTEKIASTVNDVAASLPGIYNRLAATPNLEEKLRNNPYKPDTVAPRRLKHWALKQSSAWSLNKNHVLDRLQLSAVRSLKSAVPKEMVKVANVTSVGRLADEYSMYQLAFLQSQQSKAEPELTAELAIRHNYIR